MRIAKSLVLSTALLALTAGAAGAQERRIHFNLGGGPTFGGGDLGEVFSTGWGPAFGLTFDANERIGFQFEYAYRWFSSENYVDFIGGTYAANHKFHQMDFNMVFNITKPGGVRVYAIAGPGLYHRTIEITEYIGSGIVCDPWFYICGTYPITGIIGSRNSWDWGFNVGGGVGIPIGEGAEFTIESRFHYVQGPKSGDDIGTPPPAFAGAQNKNVNGYYYPLTFGFRF